MVLNFSANLFQKIQNILPGPALHFLLHQRWCWLNCERSPGRLGRKPHQLHLLQTNQPTSTKVPSPTTISITNNSPTFVILPDFNIALIFNSSIHQSHLTNIWGLKLNWIPYILVCFMSGPKNIVFFHPHFHLKISKLSIGLKFSQKISGICFIKES